MAHIRISLELELKKSTSRRARHKTGPYNPQWRRQLSFGPARRVHNEVKGFPHYIQTCKCTPFDGGS